MSALSAWLYIKQAVRRLGFITVSLIGRYGV